MDLLTLTKVATTSVSLNKEAARAARRQTFVKLHKAQLENTERAMTRALKPFFEAQVSSAAAKLGGLAASERRSFEREGIKAIHDLTATAATAITNKIFNPRDWDKRLKAIAAPILVNAMVKAGRAEVLAMGMQLPRRKAEDDTPEVTPEVKELIAWFVEQGIPVPPGLGQMPAWMAKSITEFLEESMSGEWWDGINDTTRNDIEDTIDKGLQQGQSVQDIARDIKPVLGDEYYKGRSLNIARTESGGALNSARKGSMDALQEELGDVPMRPVWLCILDDRTREEHEILDEVPADKETRTWNCGGYDVPYPMHWSLPPELRCNCFPAGTLVSGDFVGAQRGWYEGTITEVVTRLGCRVSMTPNHPVVTSKGLVAAGKLKPGDKVMTYGEQPDTLLGTNPPESASVSGDEVNDKPALIENVFQAFASCAVATSHTSFVERRRVHVHDFYGDGKSFKGDIDIVRPDWELLENGQIGDLEKRGDSIFVRVPVGLRPELPLSDGCLELGSSFTSSRSRPSAAEMSSSCFVFVGRITPVGSCSVGPAADFDSSLLQTLEDQVYLNSCAVCDADTGLSGQVSLDHVGTDNQLSVPGSSSLGLETTFASDRNPGLNEVSSDNAVVVSKFLDEAIERFPSKVGFDEVVSVSHRYFRGHVYDLQSRYGHIVASDPSRSQVGIVTHNCRCTVINEIGMEDEEAEGLLAEFAERLLGLGEEKKAEWVSKKGGPGSGNFGHEGRPGEVGGSSGRFSSADEFGAIEKRVYDELGPLSKHLGISDTDRRQIAKSAEETTGIYGKPAGGSDVHDYVEYPYPFRDVIGEDQSVAERGDRLQSVLLSHTIPQDDVLYRGVNMQHVAAMRKVPIGGTLDLGDRFTSTTREPTVSKIFERGGETFEIHAKAGTRGAFIDDKASEILLPARTKLTRLGDRNGIMQFAVGEQPRKSVVVKVEIPPFSYAAAMADADSIF